MTDSSSEFASNNGKQDQDQVQVQDLKEVGIIELLEQDDRPIFVIDLASSLDSNPVYYNPVLQKNKGLRDRIYGLSSLYALKQASRQGPDWKFLQWLRSYDSAGHAHSSRYAQVYWVATTTKSRWRVISGVLTVQNIASEAVEFPDTGMLIPNPKHGKAASLPKDLYASPAPQTLSTDYGAVVDLKRKPSAQNWPRTSRFDTKKDNSNPDIIHQAHSHSHSVEYDAFLKEAWAFVPEEVNRFDWTVPNPDLKVTPFVSWFRNFSWSETKLGPIQGWRPQLRRAVIELIADARPCAMFWTEERVMLYNEEYGRIIGTKHPSALGKPFVEGWAELGGAFDPAFKLGSEAGQATAMDDACFFLDRAGFLEECYFSLVMKPIITDSYDMVGFSNPIFETTKKVVAERRMSFLLNLGALVAASREPKDFWNQLLAGLEVETHEVPFALLYSADEDIDESMSTSSEKMAGRKHWLLEGSVGYPEDYSYVSRLDPDEADVFIPSFQHIIQQSRPTLLRRDDGSLPQALVKGIVSRAFGDPCEAATLLPIRSTGENVLGFLLLGCNPRRAYDADYQLFIQLLSRQLATAMASALLFEEEVRQNRIAADLAALDRNELSDMLAMRTHQALEIENRFRRMADSAPVAMFQFDASGLPIYCNEVWYQMTEHPRDAMYPMSWYNVIHPEDHPQMDIEWAKLGSGLSVSFELRLRKTFSAAEIVGGERVEGFTWIIAAAYPEKAEDGTIVAILGCLTDISRQKWAEDFQTRRMREAVELKRQQENFIDMTSHEMRNPLSAIVQCADWISNSLAEYDTSGNTIMLPAELVESHMDAAQTIVLCAQHQKRIIDDVLTLSKLDSNLLLITPIDVQPALVIENSLKMFDGELQKADVGFQFKIERSYADLKIDWVKLDPSRVLQVLINLVTNAIKFTKPEQERRITVTLGASRERPRPTEGSQF